MDLINSRYKILNCIEQDYYYSQYIVLDLMKKDKKLLLYLINYNQHTKDFIEYCNNNFYVISSYKQESLLSVCNYGIVETIDDKNIADTIFFYTTEYVDTISLENIKEPLNQHELIDIYRQLSRALDFLYFHGIVYKYLGLETVGLTKQDGKINVKLLDIVSIYRMEKIKTHFHPLTYSFFAPEIISNGEIGPFTDIYGLGCLLYYLYTLTTLDHRNLHAESHNNSNSNFKSKFLNIIFKMTNRDINTRYQTFHQCNDDITKIYDSNPVIENIKDIDKINFKTPLIGRDTELKQILSACETGKGNIKNFNKNVVFINGDRGSGKTRLLNEIRYLLKWKKYKTFYTCLNKQSEGFRDIFSIILKQFIKIADEPCINKYGKELIKLVPELAFNRDIIPSEALLIEQEKLRLYDRIANFIFDVSLTNPSIILIDDFHLADETLVDFIDYLLNLNKVKKSSLLLVLSYRDDSFYYNESQSYINRWHLNNSLHIKLSRLTIEETATMIKYILGWRKDPLNFASRITKDTEGNPGYIEEAIKDLYSQGILEFNYSTSYRGFAPAIKIEDYNKIVLSKNIDESILKQVNSLDNTSREILDIVSVFNTSISKKIICNMIQINKNNHYDDFFYNLIELKILNEKFDDWGYTYGFHNKDFKQHIYNNIDKDRKTKLHIIASNILEDLYKEEGRENKDELIYHLMKSNQRDKAINYCIQAGVRMLKFFVYEQAYTFFKRANDLLEDTKDSRKLTILINLGEISQKLLKYDDAIYYLNSALELANIQNKPTEYVNAENKIGLIYSIRNEFDLAQKYLKESIRKSKNIQYYNGTMEAAYLLSRVYMSIRELKKLKFVSDKYFNLALKQNDLYYMGMFAGLKGIVEYFEENIETALKLFEESVEYLEDINKIEEASRPINNIGVIYQDHFQDAHKARMYFQKALTISEQYRKTDGIITFNNNIADTYIAENDYYKAISVLKKNLDLALEYEDETATLLVYSNLIVCYTNIEEYKQANVYLLKGNEIYEKRHYSYNGIYLEAYLEACAKFYIEVGSYDEVIKIVEHFFEVFSNAEFSIKLRMRKLYYFAKSYSGILVEEKELMQIIDDYRLTSYTRDRRSLLLDAANYFVNKQMILDAKVLLDEDSRLVNIINDNYFTLKRKYIESLLLNRKQQIVALEDMLLNQKLDIFKNMKWEIHNKLGILYLQTNQYFRSINNFLNALDIIYILFNAIPSNFRKSYLLKDDKFLVKINLFMVGSIISSGELNITKDIDTDNYKKYRDEFIATDNLDDCFDIVELESTLQNKRFYELAVEYYDKVNKTNIKSIEQLIASLTDNNINNLDSLLKLACRTTLATRGAIIAEDGCKIITNVGQNISQDKINSILEDISSVDGGIFSKSSLNPTIDFNQDLYGNDTRALMCLPIYKDSISVDTSNFEENNKRSYNGLQKRILGYLYLETDKVLNNFSEKTMEICQKLLPLASIFLTNYHLAIFSSIDRMTGTYVRKYFEQIFDREIQYANEINQPFSVIMLDIDYFKNVNDIYGHQKGDVVLTEIGSIIMNSIRVTDYVGRYGGEEFIVLLPGANKEDAYAIAEKIRNTVEKSKLLGNDAELTISCGIASFPYDANDQDEIIEKADQALYNAKENGRNRSVAWEKNITLGKKRVDKLAGIVTGNNVQDQRNVLVITEIIELINEYDGVEDKVFSALGRLIEILEADEGMIFSVKNNKKYCRKKFIEEWVTPSIFNKDLINNTILSKEGKYIIDWENINDIDPVTNTPNWKSVIVVPILVNKEVCGVIYLSVPIKEKEFDYAAYNLVQITSSVIGAILKINE